MEKQDKFQIVGPGRRNEDVVEETKSVRKLPYVSFEYTRCDCVGMPVCRFACFPIRMLPIWI